MIIDPVIYAIINIANDKHYIGQASEQVKRFREHRKTLRGNYHCNVLLQRSWNKYGENSFVFVVLEKLFDCSQLNEREQYWINLLKPEYNIAPVAGSMLGYKHTDEAKQNMSLAHKGKSHSEETKRKMSLSRTGNKYNLGVKRSRPMSEETRKKISAANKAAHRRRNKNFLKPLDENLKI